jgi:hypothetical protein
MRSDFEITSAHAQWFWDYWCACAVILRLLVCMCSDFEITGAHAQWFWDYWCACAVILRLLVRMRSDFENNWCACAVILDYWCSCAVIFRLLVRMRSYFNITVAHAQWVLDPPLVGAPLEAIFLDLLPLNLNHPSPPLLTHYVGKNFHPSLSSLFLPIFSLHFIFFTPGTICPCSSRPCMTRHSNFWTFLLCFPY